MSKDHEKKQREEELIAKFLLKGVEYPCKKSDKRELWQWVDNTYDFVMMVRKYIMLQAAHQMVHSNNPLVDAIHKLLDAKDAADPEWRKSVMGLPNPTAEERAWEQLEHLANQCR